MIYRALKLSEPLVLTFLLSDIDHDAMGQDGVSRFHTYVHDISDPDNVAVDGMHPAFKIMGQAQLRLLRTIGHGLFAVFRM